MEAPDAEPLLEPIELGPEKARAPLPWRYAGALLLGSAAGSVLLIPYTLALMAQMKDLKIPPGFMPFVMAANVGIEVIFSFLMIALGLWLGAPLGLTWPPLEGWNGGEEGKRRLRSSLLLAVALGIGSALLILGLAHTMRSAQEGGPDVKMPSWWAGLLGSIGAGIREEVWLRLGIMTFFVWVGTKLAGEPKPGAVAVWTGNLVACLLFGAIHLPQAAQLIGLTGPIVAYVLVANGVPGLIWGWLYWRKGLIAAMVSHAVADIVLKTIVPLLGQ
jgi:hypothetical protein